MSAVASATEVLDGLASGLPRHGAIRLQIASPAVAHLVIDHPARRNALSLAMMHDLACAVSTLQQWPGQALIVSAAEPEVFCAGGDLTQLPDAPPDTVRAMSRAMTVLLDALLDLPLISVAAFDGLAVGGGAELLTAVDARIGGPRAAMHFVQARLGIAPGWGGTARLVQQVGRRAALGLLTEARRLDQQELLAVGLIDRAVDGPDVVAAAEAWLAPVLGLAPSASRAVKEQVVAASPARRGEVDDESRPFTEVWGGPAHREALASLGRHRR